MRTNQIKIKPHQNDNNNNDQALRRAALKHLYPRAWHPQALRRPTELGRWDCFSVSPMQPLRGIILRVGKMRARETKSWSQLRNVIFDVTPRPQEQGFILCPNPTCHCPPLPPLFHSDWWTQICPHLPSLPHVRVPRHRLSSSLPVEFPATLVSSPWTPGSQSYLPSSSEFFWTPTSTDNPQHSTTQWPSVSDRYSKHLCVLSLSRHQKSLEDQDSYKIPVLLSPSWAVASLLCASVSPTLKWEGQ